MVKKTTPEKPEWIRIKVPSGDSWKRVQGIIEKHRLHTVCDEAQCPNRGECWGSGTAAFMILGDLCTRACRFCAVASAREGRPLWKEEGLEIARAVEELKLRYVVLTSVDRDDLPLRGADHFAACVGTVKTKNSGIRVEVLIPDYTESELACFGEQKPDVLAHNVETVRSLQWVRDRRASFDKSLATLRAAKNSGLSKTEGTLVTKSSLMLGLGEKRDEVLSVMDELRSSGVDILVLGQYLRPSPAQIPVAEYISPEEFQRYAEEARTRGFTSVVSSPFARTSYHALAAAEGTV
ncbi:MAG: lipoyl synthase [Spirochaetaceae bacterium]|jgi:lipoic acid synthetase|nr:lipoyl synthase [Spirochaetaceae bacterium]